MLEKTPFWLCCLFFVFFLAGMAHAQTTATYGESAVGVSGCNPKAGASDFDTLAHCNSSSGTGTFQKAPLYFGTLTSPPYATTTCDANKAGMIQYTGSVLQGCNGSAWNELINSTCTSPSAITFTNATNQPTASTITSNSVTLSGAGFTCTLPAVCTGCSNIMVTRSGTSTAIASGTATTLNAGDTVALQLMSSASLSTATTASLQVGTTTSSTWSVTTSASTPLPFTFAGTTNAALSTATSSGFAIAGSSVYLKGGFTNATATCGTNCTGISINGAAMTAGPVSGVNDGNTLKIQQTTSASNNASTTATVTVGVTSATWTVTTLQDVCSSSVYIPIGTVCSDGTVYAGISPDGTNKKLFTTRCNYNLTYTTACPASTGYKWSNTGTVLTSNTSKLTGATNTANLAALSNADSPYTAAQNCYNLSSYLGHSDWYLPSYDELAQLYQNATAIGGFDTTRNYWTSTDSATTSACYMNFSNGARGCTGTKTGALNVRCVRKQ